MGERVESVDGRETERTVENRWGTQPSRKWSRKTDEHCRCSQVGHQKQSEAERKQESVCWEKEGNVPLLKAHRQEEETDQQVPGTLSSAWKRTLEGWRNVGGRLGNL